MAAKTDFLAKDDEGKATQMILFRDNIGAHLATLGILATKFVTHEVIKVWAGTKTGGSDPTGTYTRDSGLDPVATLTVEAA